MKSSQIRACNWYLSVFIARNSSFGKVMSVHKGVCNPAFTGHGVCIPACTGQVGVYFSMHWAGSVCPGYVCAGVVYTLPGSEADTPLGPETDTPWTRGRHPTRARGWHSPGPEADTSCPLRYYGIRSTSRWYASYWNAFLLYFVILYLKITKACITYRERTISHWKLLVLCV